MPYNDHDQLFEPLKAYDSKYRALHNENSTKYFEELVKESGIDVAQNQATNKKIIKKDKEIKDLDKNINSLNTLKVFSGILDVISFVFGIYGLLLLAQTPFSWTNLAFLIGGLLLGILFLLIIFKKLNPKIKNLKESKNKLEQELKELINKAWAELNPLNNLFKEGMHIDLFKKTLPLINIDKLFDSRRLDYLVNRFGLFDINGMDGSTLYVESGDINGNPFYISNNLIHTLGEKTYTGSITIRWTSTGTVNGKRVTRHHTQTLTASVTKPHPYYDEVAYLVYGNDAAPDLSFTRVDTDAENMSDKQIDKMVSQGIKKLNKKSDKSLKKGGNYTVLGNQEFEVLFGATDRDHEVQFRLLFTPLAQTQLLKLMKEKEIGFGDEFQFVKQKKINVIIPNHLKTIDLNPDPSFYKGYDIDFVKDRFINYQNSYFKNIYFAFAPLLAIPLYQQQKPHEYIYKDLYDSYLSFYEHEAVANKMNESEFKHPLSQTRNILKTSVVKSGEFYDTLKVTAYGYRAEKRVDYQQKFGGDGRMHTIPIHWVEYIPVHQSNQIVVGVPEPEKELSYADRIKNTIKNLQSGKLTEKDIYRVGRLIAFVATTNKKSLKKEEK